MKNKKIVIICSIVAVALIATVVTVLLLNKKECTHNWGEWQTVKEATCMVEGEKKHICSECNKEETETIAKVGHSFTNYVAEGIIAECVDVTKTAVCDYEGCTEKDVKVEPKSANHSYELSEYNEGDCEHDEVKVYTCANCDDSYEEVVSHATGHSVSVWELTGETLKEGQTCEYVQTYEGECLKCGETVSKEEEITKHIYNVTVSQEATCQEEGIKVYSCTNENCGYSENVPYTNELAHTYDQGVVEGVVTKYSCVNSGCEHFKTAIVATEEVEASVSKENLNGNSVELKNAAIALDTKTLEALGDSDVTLGADVLDETAKDSLMGALTEEQKSQIGDNTIYNFTMKQGEDAISSFDGKVTITVPYQLAPGEDPESIAIWYVQEDGSVETIKASYANGFATFETTHFSYYTVTRLSQRERCALYGHLYTETVIKATCTKDGYTVKVCQRCGDSAKEDVVKAVGHKFEDVRVEATCTENGKVTHSCKVCNFQYVEVLPATGHTYKETEREEATTTKEGYIKYSCEVCGATKEVVLPKIQEIIGELTIADIIEKTFTNLDFRSLVLTIKDYEMTIIRSNYVSGSSYAEVMQTGTIEICELYLGLDNNNQLVGSGKVKVKTSATNMNSVMNAEVYLANGQLYLFSNEVDQGIAADNYYGKLDIEHIILTSMEQVDKENQGTHAVGVEDVLGLINGYTGENFESFADIEEYLNEVISWAEENVKPFFDNLYNTNKEVLESVLLKALEILYNLNKLENGYEISLNVESLNDLYKYLTETKVYDIIEDIVGSAILGDLDLVFNYNVDALIKYLESKGLVITDLVSVIDKVLQYVYGSEEVTLNLMLQGMMKDETFDIIAFLNSDEIRKISVKDVIENYTDFTVEELKAQANQMLTQFKEVTILDMVGMTKESEIIVDIEQALAIATNGFDLTFAISKEFKLEKIALNINIEQTEANEELLPEGYKMNFAAEVLFDKTSIYDLSPLKVKVDSLCNEILPNINIETLLDYGFKEYKEYDWYKDYKYETVYNGDVLEKVIVSYAEEHVKEGSSSADGNYTVTGYETEYVNEIYVNDILNALQYNFEEYCNDWYEVYVDAAVRKTVREKEVTYSYENYELVDESEYVLEEKSYCDVDNFKAVFNTNTNETKEYDYDSDNGHRWILDATKTIEAETCGEYSQEWYVCLYCGNERVEYNYKNHQFYYKDVTLHGTSCEDGYDYVVECQNCDQVHLEGYNDEHDTLVYIYDVQDYGATCEGEIEYGVCACESNSWISFETKCDLDWSHSSESNYTDLETVIDSSWDVHDIEERICSVTDPTACKFRYTRVWYRVQSSEHSCLTYEYATYYIGHSANKLGDAKLVITVGHGYRYDHNYELTTDTETKEVYECTCGAKKIYEYTTYNQNGKEFIRRTLERYENEDPLNQSWSQTKYTYTFDSCCVEIREYTDSNGKNSYYEECVCLQWDWYVKTTTLKEATCTQNGLAISQCEICGKQGEPYETSPYCHSWMYDYNNQIYECRHCGLKNINGASGAIVLEDASDMDSDSDTLIVGYYNRQNIEYILNVTLILKEPLEDGNDQILVEGVNISYLPNGRYVSFSQSEVEALARELGYEVGEYNIRLSFVPTEYYDELDYAITFE